MSAERDELERLVHEIPDDQVPAALTGMRRHVRPASRRPWPPPWFGIAPGDGTSIANRADELLAEGFNRQD